MKIRKSYQGLVQRGMSLVIMAAFVFLSGCGKNESVAQPEAPKVDRLILGAYTVPKEAYMQKLIPAFKDIWLKKTGRQLDVESSYIASGAQSRAIEGGMEADIAALSLEHDIDRLVKAGLIATSWKNSKYNGFVTRSVVAMVVREGNPKQIKGWQDLLDKQLDVIYPSPRTSGGAMWIVNAIYGAGLKISELKTGKQDMAEARKFLKTIQGKVKVMDNSGRASVTTFENGFGDVLLTYENEALLRQMQGKNYPFVVPDATILIENPIAIVDKNVDKHGNRVVVEAFVEYLLSPEAQRVFAEFGFRPVDDAVMMEVKDKYPVPAKLFDITYLGGWTEVDKNLYGPEGCWTQIIQELGK